MKKPRVEDFDPNAVPALGSPLDDYPRIERPSAGNQPSPTVEKSAVSDPVPPLEHTETDQASSSPSLPSDTQPVRPYGSTPGRTDGRPDGKRTITRYAFEFFQDQIESLRQFSLNEKLRGEKGSMSVMVREAVDMYIAKRKNRETE